MKMEIFDQPMCCSSGVCGPKVDKKLVEINKACFKIDAAIKAANARTTVVIDVDFDALMSEIE